MHTFSCYIPIVTFSVFFRDFRLGENIDDEINRHMSNSKAHIVVISEISLQKTWPTYELRRAYIEHLEHKKELIVIKLGNISSNEVPGLVKQILDSKIYCNWPEAHQGMVTKRIKQRQELFWARLASKLYGGEYPCYLMNPCCMKIVHSGTIKNYLDDDIELLWATDNNQFGTP